MEDRRFTKELVKILKTITVCLRVIKYTYTVLINDRVASNLPLGK